MMSGSAPTPLTMRPSRDRRIVTSPCDCVPVLMALTENKTSSAPLAAALSMALTVASTGPSPSPTQLRCSPPTRNSTRARGTAPVVDCCVSEMKR